MFLNQRCARAEDGRKGEKKTADGGSKTTADETGTEGGAAKRPAKLLGRRTSPRMAKADTTTPPTRKRTTYSVISLSSRVSTVAHRSRRPDPCAAGAPSKWS